MLLIKTFKNEIFSKFYNKPINDQILKCQIYMKDYCWELVIILHLFAMLQLE